MAEVKFYNGPSDNISNAPKEEDGVFVHTNETHGLYQSDGHQLIPISNNVYTVTIPIEGWISDDPGSHIEIHVDGITAADNPIADVMIDDASTYDERIVNWSAISAIETHDGYITVYAYNERPQIELYILLKV